MEPESVAASDAVIDALADGHRRTILREVAENGQTATSVETLTDAVAGASSDQLSEDEYRQRMLISLHHRHLPKLADAGLIRYDADAGRVRAELDESERDLLETVAAHENGERR